MDADSHNGTDRMERVRQNDEIFRHHIIDKNSGVASSCSNDMTHMMPSCLQACDMWCWVTVSSMAGNYYKGENECDNWECNFATYLAQHSSWDDPPDTCCPASNECNPVDGDDYVDDHCNLGGGADKVITGLDYFTGGSFTEYGPLTQTDLDSALNSGRVVMMEIDWDPSPSHGGHWLIIGGCGDGYYYVHDPYSWYEAMQGKQPADWQGLTFEQVLRYPCPGVYRTDGGENVGIWIGTVMWDLGDEERHAQAVTQASRKQGRSDSVSSSQQSNVLV